MGLSMAGKEKKKAIGFLPMAWCFMVAGGGFEPPTFGL